MVGLNLAETSEILEKTALRFMLHLHLTDAEWDVLQPHLPPPAGRGRPREHGWREILNGVFYLVRSGCAWRLLPHNLPPWKTVYRYYRLWRIDGNSRRTLLTVPRLAVKPSAASSRCKRTAP